MQITCAEGNLALTQANWEDAIYWLYQEDDFTPTARYEKGQLHYTVADQVGTITELLTEDGYIDYRQKLNLWGEAEIDGHRHYAANDSNPLKCNHRFVGQYYDDESELHYNRFRYYSPETGQYISHDPIGLLGGLNPYGYLGIPTAFVDPLGLAGCPHNNDRNSNAESAANGAKLREHLRQQEKYGQGGMKELPDGRIRYYGELREARTPGQMAGMRPVREWNPETGQKRTWMETIDHNGNVRQVRPQESITNG